MKFFFPIIAALSLSSALAVDTKQAAFVKALTAQTSMMQGEPIATSIRGGGDRNLQMDTTVCIPDFEFTSEKGCTTEGIAQMVNVLTRRLERKACPHNAVKELKLMLGVTTQKEVWEFFYQQCFAFWSTQETQNLKDIGDGTDVFLKAFYDGGTYWNDARQTSATPDNSTINVLSQDPGLKIDGVNNNQAKFGVINLPEEISNFDTCKSNSAMCCWVQDRQADDDGNCQEPYDENCVNANPADNTDVCLVEIGRAPKSNRVRNGFAIFGSNVESATHCHGFAWTEDELDPNTIFKGNNLFYISMYDHLYKRGYVKNVPGAPMCGCTEQMPVVSRADCTQVSVRQDVTFSFATQLLTVVYQDAYAVEFTACRAPDAPNNNLEAFYKRLVNEKRARPMALERLQRTLVGQGNCTNVIDDFVAGLGA